MISSAVRHIISSHGMKRYVRLLGTAGFIVTAASMTACKSRTFNSDSKPRDSLYQRNKNTDGQVVDTLVYAHWVPETGLAGARSALESAFRIDNPYVCVYWSAVALKDSKPSHSTADIWARHGDLLQILPLKRSGSRADRLHAVRARSITDRLDKLIELKTKDQDAQIALRAQAAVTLKEIWLGLSNTTDSAAKAISEVNDDKKPVPGGRITSYRNVINKETRVRNGNDLHIKTYHYVLDFPDGFRTNQSVNEGLRETLQSYVEKTKQAENDWHSAKKRVLDLETEKTAAIAESKEVRSSFLEDLRKQDPKTIRPVSTAESLFTTFESVLEDIYLRGSKDEVGSSPHFECPNYYVEIDAPKEKVR